MQNYIVGLVFVLIASVIIGFFIPTVFLLTAFCAGLLIGDIIRTAYVMRKNNMF